MPRVAVTRDSPFDVPIRISLAETRDIAEVGTTKELALEKRHLVTRNPSDTDKRVIAVALTEKGRQSIAEVDRIVRKFDRELAKHLGETKVSLFAEDLRRMLELDSL